MLKRSERQRTEGNREHMHEVTKSKEQKENLKWSRDQRGMRKEQ